MTVQQMEIVAPAGEPVITYRRFVPAPPELVFEAWTKPEHLAQWLGPAYLEMSFCEIDLRVGGGYRFVHRAPDGTEHGFHGEYLEVVRPSRLVTTFIYEGMPDAHSVDALNFEATEGGTLLHGTSTHSSVADRDQHLANGMEAGVRESYERLDAYVAEMQARG